MNSVLIKPDQIIDNLNVLTKQYIYVDNKGTEYAGAYLGAKRKKARKKTK